MKKDKKVLEELRKFLTASEESYAKTKNPTSLYMVNKLKNSIARMEAI